MLAASCRCGAVQMQISGDAIAQLHCHCETCQLAHSAAYVSVALYPAESVQVLGGELQALVMKKNLRQRCAACGTFMFTEVERVGWRGVNAYVLPKGSFSPQFHAQCEDAVHPIADDLPHYKGFPARLGGSDETVAW